MCGIVGYIGTKKAVPILINGLEAVEYRGYDSAGVCLGGEKLLLKKAKGPVAALKKKIDAELNVNRGIAHTRWATHGRPDEKNAHPHMDCGQSLALVHNGIIENFLDLKKKLSNGHKIVSDTDSEILVHLIEEEMMIKGDSLSAVISALRKVKGSYALAIIGEKNSNELLVAKMGSPLVVGESDDGFYVASDVNALAGYVKKVLYLQDGDVALISNQRFLVKDLENKTVKRFWKKMLVQSTDIQKGGYKFFMEKEIREQPEILRRLIKQDIINKNTGNIKKAGEILAKARKVRISACGSAYYAGLT
ncbi:glutamine--fructose-6-phosphate aminotransferase, partial [Candidatus Parcubacteria bacterium]